MATLATPPCPSSHHRMIFGVSSEGLYLTSPVEVLRPSKVLQLLRAQPFMTVARDEVLKRLNNNYDLRKLTRLPGNRWNEMNVVGRFCICCHDYQILKNFIPGQVSTLLLEEQHCTSLSDQPHPPVKKTPHVSIPTEIPGGISIFALKNSKNLKILQEIFN